MVSELKNLIHTQHTVENKKKERPMRRPMSSSSPCIEDRKGLLEAAEQDTVVLLQVLRVTGTDYRSAWTSVGQTAQSQCTQDMP